ncbi:TrmB family transcriptional regulator [Streptomyces sp. NPDC056013]|uniref:TrmB family transcriptional regulator n=1 Tax=Streptomyces sp. NPDC056013 TaxID=3345680 RepID=UPI0035E01F38
MLQALGLGRNEEAVYTALLSRPTASSQELVRQTGLGESEVDRVLLDLSERGLVVVAAEGDDRLPDPSDGGSPRPSARYRLTPPSVALAPLLVEQRNALHRAEAAFTMLTEQYRSTAAHPAGSVVEVVVGREQVAHRFHQLQRGAQRELLMFLVGEPSAVAREDADVSESSALDRGVGLNTLPARSGIEVGLSVEGHAGYTPGAITAASLSYSYDGGATWTEAPTTRLGGRWTAVLDHTGADGSQVMTKASFTDAHGNAVTQTITRAYDVR